MASTALQPAAASANAIHYGFEAALRHFADARARRINLLPSRTLSQELAAAEAVERAVARLTVAQPADLKDLRDKLYVLLRVSGVPLAMRAAICADLNGFITRGVAA